MRLTIKGVYEGFTALYLTHGRVTMGKVVAMKSGNTLKGLRHFFSKKIFNGI